MESEINGQRNPQSDSAFNGRALEVICSRPPIIGPPLIERASIHRRRRVLLAPCSPLTLAVLSATSSASFAAVPASALATSSDMAPAVRAAVWPVCFSTLPAPATPPRTIWAAGFHPKQIAHHTVSQELAKSLLSFVEALQKATAGLSGAPRPTVHILARRSNCIP